MAEVYLVICAKAKRDSSAPASELYVSPNFRKFKALAEKRTDRWYILSAKHGLLKPEQVIEPYDLTLNDMKTAERKRWALGVFERLKGEVSPSDRITMLAGRKYWDVLKPLLEDYGCEVLSPLKSIAQFKWEAWLNRGLAEG